MIDHQKLLDSKGIDNLTPELKKFFNETWSNMKGCQRRKFMVKVVLLMGRGGQIRAARNYMFSLKSTEISSIHFDKTIKLMVANKLSVTSEKKLDI